MAPKQQINHQKAEIFPKKTLLIRFQRRAQKSAHILILFSEENDLAKGEDSSQQVLALQFPDQTTSSHSKKSITFLDSLGSFLRTVKKFFT